MMMMTTTVKVMVMMTNAHSRSIARLACDASNAQSRSNDPTRDMTIGVVDLHSHIRTDPSWSTVQGIDERDVDSKVDTSCLIFRVDADRGSYE